MKQPSIPLQIAYKMVRVDKSGQMWSVNSTPASGRHCVRYKLRSQVFPADDDFGKLFICSNLTEACKAYDMYFEYWSKQTNQPCQKVYMLRGYAANVSDFEDVLPRHFWGILPTRFKTSVCDWFIPIGIIKTKR